MHNNIGTQKTQDVFIRVDQDVYSQMDVYSQNPLKYILCNVVGT